jgi:N-methylhydantoinase A
MLMTDARLDYAHPYLRVAAEAGLDEITGVFGQMCKKALDDMKADGFDESQVFFQRSFDVRYLGQEHTINVMLPDGALKQKSLDDLKDTFESLHRARYAFTLEGVPVELVFARVVSVARITRPTLKKPEHAGKSPDRALVSKNSRVYLEGAWQPIPIYRRERLQAGNQVTGPAIVSEAASATVLYSGQTLTVDPYGNLVIDTGV